MKATNYFSMLDEPPDKQMEVRAATREPQENGSDAESTHSEGTVSQASGKTGATSKKTMQDMSKKPNTTSKSNPQETKHPKGILAPPPNQPVSRKRNCF